MNGFIQILPPGLRRALKSFSPDRMAKILSDRFAEIAWEYSHGIPLIKYVQIQTQSRCNADCLFCPYSESWHAENPGRMSDDLFNKVLEQLLPFSYGINKGKVCPYLMQEPLLDSRIFKRIQLIYKYFPGTLVEISTNAMVLNDKVTGMIMDIFPGRRHEIWISHHGIDKSSMEYIMKIDYEKSKRNLIKFLKRADGNLRIRIRGAGTSKNRYFNFFTSGEYIDYWRRVISNEGINTSNVDIDSFRFHDRAGSINRRERNAYMNNQGIVRKIDSNHPFRCGRIDEWIHIMYDGRIRICCMDYHGEVDLPNIKDMTIEDYLRSDAFRELRNMVKGRKKSPDNFICKRCSSPGG